MAYYAIGLNGKTRFSIRRGGFKSLDAAKNAVTKHGAGWVETSPSNVVAAIGQDGRWVQA